MWFYTKTLQSTTIMCHLLEALVVCLFKKNHGEYKTALCVAYSESTFIYMEFLPKSGPERKPLRKH
jgi:hypothetical protein